MKYNFEKMPIEEVLKIIEKIPDGRRKADHQQSMCDVLEAMKQLRIEVEKEALFLEKYVSRVIKRRNGLNI